MLKEEKGRDGMRWEGREKAEVWVGEEGRKEEVEEVQLLTVRQKGRVRKVNRTEEGGSGSKLAL